MRIARRLVYVFIALSVLVNLVAHFGNRPLANLSLEKNRGFLLSITDMASAMTRGLLAFDACDGMRDHVDRKTDKPFFCSALEVHLARSTGQFYMTYFDTTRDDVGTVLINPLPDRKHYERPVFVDMIGWLNADPGDSGFFSRPYNGLMQLVLVMMTTPTVTSHSHGANIIIYAVSLLNQTRSRIQADLANLGLCFTVLAGMILIARQRAVSKVVKSIRDAYLALPTAHRLGFNVAMIEALRYEEDPTGTSRAILARIEQERVRIEREREAAKDRQARAEEVRQQEAKRIQEAVTSGILELQSKLTEQREAVPSTVWCAVKRRLDILNQKTEFVDDDRAVLAGLVAKFDAGVRQLRQYDDLRAVARYSDSPDRPVLAGMLDKVEQPLFEGARSSIVQRLLDDAYAYAQEKRIVK